MRVVTRIEPLAKEDGIEGAREALIAAILRFYDARGYERGRIERDQIRPLVRRLEALCPEVYGPRGAIRGAQGDEAV